MRSASHFLLLLLSIKTSGCSVVYDIILDRACTVMSLGLCLLESIGDRQRGAV